jgi:hypothetical protein
MTLQNTFQFVAKSANVKTGPIPVSYTDRGSCPPDCPLYGGNGCYGEDYFTRMVWDKVPARGVGIDQFSQSIAGLAPNTFWRHDVVGDLPGAGVKIDPIQLGAIVWANRGKRGFTYTHKTTDPANLQWIKHSNDWGFTVNLSGNSLAHADQLADTGVGPVVCIVPIDAPEKLQTPAGRSVVVCPAQTREDVTCQSCQLCQRQNRAVIVGFRAHGSRSKRVDQMTRKTIPIQSIGA